MTVSIRCECGVRKPKFSEACPRCTRLDGRRGSFWIIAALREFGLSGGTVAEVAEASGISERNTLRCLGKMVASGLVRRWVDDESTGPARYRLRGG